MRPFLANGIGTTLLSWAGTSLVFEEFWKFLKHEALNINEIRMVAPYLKALHRSSDSRVLYYARFFFDGRDPTPAQWTETLPLANQLSSRVTLPPLSDTITRGVAISPLRRS
jgi:hypothetical protein